MPRKYKFFISDFSILITDDAAEMERFNGDQSAMDPDAVYAKLRDHFNALTLKRNEAFLHPNPEELVNRLYREFTVIHAGGGVVFRESGELLMIKRRGHWDLPKGKLEAGESLQECALREVEEECGIQVLLHEASPAPFNTHHLYREGDQVIIKASHWFRMRAMSVDAKPQIEEDISAVVWNPVPVDLDRIQPCFGSIVEVLHHFGVLSA